jgi:hypothetical protein
MSPRTLWPRSARSGLLHQWRCAPRRRQRRQVLAAVVGIGRAFSVAAARMSAGLVCRSREAVTFVSEGAMAGAGLLGYGVYEAAQMVDAVFQLIYHSGLEQSDANRSKFRKMLQDSMSESGYGLHDIAESAKQEIRMFAGTPGHGIDVLPEMLRAATIESRLKGESPEESMRALIGLAHMTKQYSPEAIKKLAPAFAFLSTANPSSLSSIERAAGYAVPLLQSGLEIDPMQSLLLGTALTRAGATNTKSGTWLREMALRAMPGTSMMSKMAFKKHEEALKEVGLVDDKDKPTWFTDGKPDLLKMLDIAGANAQKIPIEKRAAIERGLFGAQGGGGFALLADPAVREQILSLQKEMNSPEFKNRYSSFSETYKEGSTVQQPRTAMAEFNMMELGKTVLPSVNVVLKDFKSTLEGIRNVLPGGKTGLIGARAAEGAGAGFLGGRARRSGAGRFGRRCRRRRSWCGRAVHERARERQKRAAAGSLSAAHRKTAARNIRRCSSSGGDVADLALSQYRWPHAGGSLQHGADGLQRLPDAGAGRRWSRPVLFGRPSTHGQMTMAELMTDRDIEECVAAAADLALFFVGSPENGMLLSLYQVRANLEAELAETFGPDVADAVAQAFVATAVGVRSRPPARLRAY